MTGVFKYSLLSADCLKNESCVYVSECVKYLLRQSIRLYVRANLIAAQWQAI